MQKNQNYHEKPNPEENVFNCCNNAQNNGEPAQG